jgi:hypothetical protein
VKTKGVGHSGMVKDCLFVCGIFLSRQEDRVMDKQWT